MSWNLRRSGTRRNIALCLAGLFLALLAFQVWGDRGYRALQRRLQEEREWEARNETLRRHNAELDQRIRDLNTPKTIERIAREDLGMTRPGERVIRTPGKR
jgi:cell division protein FtsB